MNNLKSNEFTNSELNAIHEAAAFFENPGVFVKSFNWIGVPFEFAQSKIPLRARKLITQASQVAIEKALDFSIKTVFKEHQIESFSHSIVESKKSGLYHAGVSTIMGGVGGFFGLAALPFELPISTLIMLRSIAEIAQTYGHDLSSIDTRLECMYVFTLGNKSPQDNAMDSAYYTSRVLFSETLKNVTAHIAGLGTKEILQTLENKTAPLLVRFVTEIATQFEIRVTKKFLLQLAPIAGALGGAGINFLFAHFFQECARHHFGMKRIEMSHGLDSTQKIFELARNSK